MKSLRFFTVALLLAFAAYYALEHSYRAYPVFTGKTMGTYYMVKINAPRVSRKVHRDIVKVLKKVNRRAGWRVDKTLPGNVRAVQNR